MRNSLIFRLFNATMSVSDLMQSAETEIEQELKNAKMELEKAEKALKAVEKLFKSPRDDFFLSMDNMNSEHSKEVNAYWVIENRASAVKADLEIKKSIASNIRFLSNNFLLTHKIVSRASLPQYLEKQMYMDTHTCLFLTKYFEITTTINAKKTLSRTFKGFSERKNTHHLFVTAQKVSKNTSPYFPSSSESNDSFSIPRNRTPL